MNNFLKITSLLIAVLFLSYLTAGYFGSVYDSMFGSGSAWIGSERSWNLIVGFPLSLIFFLILFSYAWMFKSKSSTLWLISPLLLWQAVVDIRHIYVPIILALIGFGLAVLLRKIFEINKHTEPSPQ